MLRIVALVMPFLGAVVHYFHYAGRLPKRIATHFGLDGTANGWMSSAGFFVFYFCFLALLLGVFTLGVPLMVSKLPASMINIPNREYWLAPERRTQTKQRVGKMFAAFGLAVGLFVVAVMQLTIDANLGSGPPKLESTLIWPLAGVFLLFVTGFVVQIRRAFSRNA